MIYKSLLRPAAVVIVLVGSAVFAAEEPTPEDADGDGGLMDQTVPVAEEDAALDSAAGSDPPRRRKADLRDELGEEFSNYKRLMSEGIYDEADTVAKRVVTLSIQLNGPRSTETSKALTNLGIVQHRNKQFDAAQQNFEAAIDIIEENEDRLNGRLINPLKGLGAAQLEGGRPDLAQQTFTRAIHITHVNKGPHNMDQIEILESLAEANVRLGEIEDAREMHDKIYLLHRRRYEDDQLALIPSLMRRAEWQHRAGYIVDEQATYRRAIRIIETSASKNDIRLVEPLTKLGESYFFTDLHGEQTMYHTAVSGEIYFKRALKIAESNPKSDWTTTTNSRLSLADYYMMMGNVSRAQKLYKQIWESLSSGETKLLFRDEIFGRAVPLNDRQGSVTVSFSITDRGRVTEMEPVEVIPAEFTDMQKRVHREVRGRLYRPRFEESEPVKTSDEVFTHLFYYKQSDLEERRESAAGNSDS
jgi:tetratricopeptide (TPR) repeat protein